MIKHKIIFIIEHKMIFMIELEIDFGFKINFVYKNNTSIFY